ncbi:MAG: hypothetical protein ACJAUT_000833 [Cellvibrionaceae bacterium]|jgi:hypothetical protein
MLKKRIIAVGSLLLSLLLLSLGSNVEVGQKAYFFPNLIAYFLIGFSCLLLIVEGKLFDWLGEIKIQLSTFMFSTSNKTDIPATQKKYRNISAYSILYTSISRVVSTDNESLVVLRRLRDEFFSLIPMLVIIFIYLSFAETIGLYSTSLIAFLLIVLTYTDVRPRSKKLKKNIFISFTFMGVIYLIFAILLKLQTPNAWLI